MIASAARPIAIPAMMDSIGKPGTAGITRGVVVLDDCVTVTVAKELEVSLDVLSVELVTSLVEVTTEDVLVSDVLVELTVLEATLVLELVDEVVLLVVIMTVVV